MISRTPSGLPYGANQGLRLASAGCAERSTDNVAAPIGRNNHLVHRGRCGMFEQCVAKFFPPLQRKAVRVEERRLAPAVDRVEQVLIDLAAVDTAVWRQGDHVRMARWRPSSILTVSREALAAMGALSPCPGSPLPQDNSRTNASG